MRCVTNSRLLDFWCWLGWFGHVERKDDNDWVKRCITWEVEGIRQRGRPKKTLWDCVKNDMESLGLPKRMHSPGINGEGELRGQPANPGSPGKMAVKTEYMCVCVWCWFRSPCEYRNIFSGIFTTAGWGNFVNFADNFRSCQWIYMKFFEWWDVQLANNVCFFGAGQDYNPITGIYSKYVPMQLITSKHCSQK